MKSFLLFFVLLLLGSCIMHYDRLNYYKEGYTPNNAGFRTNGFYYTSADSSIRETWPNSVIEIYFFKNGTFLYGSNYENLELLDTLVCQPNTFKYGPFGFYTIQNDTILGEMIETDPMGDHTAIRSAFKAVQTIDGIKILGWNGKIREKNWTFHQNDCVPDSIYNWLVTHRKYRIDR